MCAKRCEGLFRQNRKRSTCMYAETDGIRNIMTIKVIMYDSHPVLVLGQRTEMIPDCIDYKEFNEHRMLWVRALIGSSKRSVITYTRHISNYVPVPDVRKDGNICSVNKEYVYDYCTTRRDKCSPIRSAMPSSVGPHHWVGTNILLWSKEAAKMNTEMLVW